MEERRDDKNDGGMAKRLSLHYNFSWCSLSYSTTCGAGAGCFLKTEELSVLPLKRRRW